MQRDLGLLKIERHGGMIAACPRYSTTDGPLIPRMRAHSMKYRTPKALVGIWKIPKQVIEAPSSKYYGRL